MYMKKKNLILTGILACMCITAGAAGDNDEPKGKPIVQVFTNFHSGFGSDNNDRGFDLDRSYLGYEYSFGNGIKIKGVMDIGKSNDVDDYQRIAYIKNAMISWKTGNLTLNGGLISTTQFGTQEKFWGNRYVMKSFQDQYKFGNSADMGISAAYKFNDVVSADAIVTNGEGYKKEQIYDGMMYGMGITVKPVSGLTLRVYGGINESKDKEGKDIYNVATFAGYSNKAFSLGCEYNMMKNAGNTKNHDLQGVSVYASAGLNKNTKVYARYDQLFSKDDWNMAKDEQAVIAGAEFKLMKYIKISPNFRFANPKDDAKSNRYMAYISCYFGI